MWSRSIFFGSVSVLAATIVSSCVNDDHPAKASYQGWSPGQQDRWYAGTQGSRLMPLSWLKALEQAGSEKPFLDAQHIAGFRLLPRQNALPVGFAIDDNDDTDLTVSKLRWFAGQQAKEHWVGLNCAACHTAHIDYGAKQLRVDGGPSLFDYQSFVEAIDAALKATLASASAPTAEGQAKWNRFATAVFACAGRADGCTSRPEGWSRDDAANRGMLATELGKLIAWEDRVEHVNKTPLRYGYGRVDAFGHIFNKVALFNGAPNPTVNPADAPVSYPFLWDIYRHDKLQWNGIVQASRISLGARDLDVGALGRNTGEVIGVFGDVAVTPNAGLRGYASSVWADNLENLERQLMSLKAPSWPKELFGPVGGDTVQGRQIFADKCASCHAPQPGTVPYKVHMVPLTPTDPNGTDPWMACNAIRYTSAPGRLVGTPIAYLGNGPRYKAGEDAPIADMLTTTVKGTLAGKKGQIIAQAGRIFLGIDGRPRVVSAEETPDVRGLILAACYAQQSPLMAYKARPLDGIWATAPYLHNGSVASLDQLLLSPAKRLRSFPVGTRQYDPVRVGYSIDPQATGNTFTYDTSKTGNSNAGHDYGVGTLTEPQRQALLAYLKTL
ncbi:di-heme-cytochrome C peroxidase [Sphingomonas sp. GB1N7]|uniref:di-heme-cytochrome C peroxidase n=1 Tax=Parasphingomonas caseinilytica TaxID=3096158 RepID=UPI002FCAC440